MITPIKLILFDLGGVLIELGNLSTLWHDKRNNHTEEELWNLWLNNEFVSKMDKGQITTETFCKSWIAHWQLNIAYEDFLKLYENLIIKPYPGAVDLVQKSKNHFQVGCLSNMNPCHWPRIQSFGLADLFDHAFVSHQLELVKPQSEIFEHVLEELTFESNEILFLDDNQINVTRAREHGIQAKKVKGIQETQEVVDEACRL